MELFVIATFKALYNAFLKKSVDDVLWPGLKGLFRKKGYSSLESCFNQALNKVMEKHSDSNTESVRKKLKEEFIEKGDIIANLPSSSDTYISEIYKVYLHYLDESPILKRLVKWHFISLTESAMTKINDDFSHLASDVSKVSNDVHKLMLSKGLSSDVTIKQSDKQTRRFDRHIILRDDVGNLLPMLQACKILNLYGARLIGKSILAQQIINASKLDAEIIDLHYRKDINAIDIIKDYDQSQRIIVIDNLNYRFGDDYSERIIDFILESNLKSTFIITTIEPLKDLTKGTSTRGILTFQVKEFTVDEMEKIAYSYEMPHDFVLKKLVYNGFCHPLVANACCKLCKDDEWKGSKVLEDLLFRVQYFDLPRKLSVFVSRFVPEEHTRHLMARISLLRLGTIHETTIIALANVHPSISGYKEKLTALIPDWIQQDKNVFHVSNLLKYWNYGLLEEEKKSCYIATAKSILNKKVLTPIELSEIIICLVNGGQYDDAGYIYTSALEKLKEFESDIKEKPLFASFWIDLPLPDKMSDDVKIIVRISQLTSFITEEKYKKYIVKDLLRIANLETVPDKLKFFTYRLLAFYAASISDLDLAHTCIELNSKLAMTTIDLPSQFKKEQEELDEKFNQISTYFLFTSKDLEEFKKSLQNAKIDISLSLAFEFSRYTLGRLCPEKDLNKLDWITILSKYNEYLKAIRETDNENLNIAFTTRYLLVVGKEIKDVDLLEKYFKDLKQASPNTLAMAMYQYALGYSYYINGNYKDALSILNEANKQSSNLPLNVAHKILYLLSYLYAIDNNVEKRLAAINAIEFTDDGETTERDKAEYYGEKALALWDAKHKEAAISIIEDCLDISIKLLQSDKDNYLNKCLLSKVGMCVQQWYAYLTKGDFLKDYATPMPGLFTERFDSILAEGDYDMKPFGILLQAYHLDTLTINRNAGKLARQMMECSKQHPNRLHSVLNILTIPMILDRQYSALSELLSIDKQAKAQSSPSDMPQANPTDSFMNFYILPLLMNYIVEMQSMGSSTILGDVVISLIKEAQEYDGYCDKEITNSIIDIIEGKEVDLSNVNISVKVTSMIMNLAGDCRSTDAFIYLYSIIHNNEKLYSSIVGGDRLMCDFAFSVLQKQINTRSYELDINCINGKGISYIDSSPMKIRYKKVMKVFYFALKQDLNEPANIKNQIIDWLDE
jgi:tetratricopeptide (TPR) repeat protein